MMKQSTIYILILAFGIINLVAGKIYKHEFFVLFGLLFTVSSLMAILIESIIKQHEHNRADAYKNRRQLYK